MDRHPRDGTLLKKKQEQWARERADKESAGEWYPFGSPGGGSPNRKHTSICYAQQEDADCSTSKINVHEKENSLSPATSNQQRSGSPAVLGNAGSTVSSVLDSSRSSENDKQVLSNPLLAPYTQTISSWQPLPYAYNMLPPGVIPIPITVPNGVAGMHAPDGMIPFVPNYAGNLFYSPALFSNVPNSVCSNVSTELGEEPSKGTANEVQQNGEPNNIATNTHSLTLDTLSVKHLKDNGTVNTQFKQNENDENRLNQNNENTFEEIWSKEEDEVQKKRIEAENLKKRRESQLADALEKAKQEAEILKKAKLFKHVLEGNDRSPELEEKILGVDCKTGDRILNEINQWERHKKREHQELEKARISRKSRDGSGSTRSTSARSQDPSPRRRSKSMDIEGTSLGTSVNCSTPNSRRAEKNSSKSSNPNAGKNGPAVGSLIPLTRNNIQRLSLRSPNYKFNKRDDTVVAQHTSSPCSSNKDNGQSKIPVVLKKNKNEDSTTRAPVQRYYEDSKYVQPSEEGANTFSKKKPSISRVGDDKNPLLNPIATRKMRPTAKTLSTLSGTVGSLDSNEETSSGSECQMSPNESPVPSIVIENSDAKKPNGTELLTTPKSVSSSLRSRSTLNSTNLGTPLNGSLGLRAAIYKQKIAQKGCSNHDEDSLSPDVRRKAEATLSRTSSMASLRGSISNLRGSMSNLNINIEDSPALGRFKSMNPAYRSFNNKKCNERQKATLQRLSQLREQLRAKENFLDRGSSLVPSTSIKS